MKYLLLVLLAGYAVKCDDNYFVVEAPEDYTEDHERPFNVYWNVPTMQCKSKKIPFKNLYERYGIHQNKEDSFLGDRVSILYDPGLFPAILKNKTTGTLHLRNGGVPQEGDLELHLKTFKSILNKKIPDPDFDGVGIIDFEWWRPIFRQNMGNLVITKNISIEIQKNLYWEPDQDIHKAARLRFEKAARTFMKTTLSVAKQMRPNALWGYYGFPYCFNMANKNMKETCADKVPEENDRTRWLWSESTALYPSVYSSKDLTTSQLALFIRGRIKEAQRVKRKGTAVLPYFWFRYREGGFLTEEDLQAALETLYNSHASGFIIWGGSEDVNTVNKCKDLLNYVENTLGPAISEFTKGKTKTREDILQTKKKGPHHKLTEITNLTYHEDLELYWKPPENCVKDINKYVEEELERKGYSFNDINEVMTHVNYSIHIKIPFRSLMEKSTVMETKDSSKVNSVTNLLKDIQNTPNVPNEETSQISTKMIILKKLLQIQQLTKEIIDLEAAETINLKDVAHKHLKADFSTIQDDVKKDNTESTSEPAADLVVFNSTLSTVESTTTVKLDEATQIPSEYVSNENTTGTEPTFKTSTENVVAKFSENLSRTQYYSTELSQNYENSNETSSGDHLIVKLLEDSQEATKSPIIESTQTIEVKDVTYQNLNTDITTPQGDLNEENLEITKSLLSESFNLNHVSLIKENSAIETMDKQTYTLPIESVSNITGNLIKASTEEPKLLENRTSNIEYTSTKSTQSFENSNTTVSGDNVLTKLIENYQTTIETPILETIHLRNDTHKDLSSDVAAVQNDTKKDIGFASKLIPIENLQLNDTFYYIIETSTTEPQQTDTIPIEKVSIEIRDNETGFVLKTSTDDLPKVLENDPSSKVSTENYKNSDKSSTAEPLNPKLEDNQQVTTETTISEATQTIDVEDITENNLHVDVTTLQDDLKEENITLALEPLPIEPMQLNNALYYSIETPIKETEDKLTMKFSTENVSKEIITKESKPKFKTSADNLDAILLENQTSSAELIQNNENSDKTISGENVGSNSFRQNIKNRLEISSTEMPSQESKRMSSTEVLVMELLENKDMTTEIPDLVVREIIDPKNVVQESFNTDVAKEQDDLKTEEIEIGSKKTPIQLIELTTEKTPKEITSNETEPLFKASTEDLEPKLLENRTTNIEYTSTKSTQSFENSNTTVSGDNVLTKLIENYQTTIETPILETIHLRNDTHKDLSSDVAAVQNDTKKDIGFASKLIPIENLQLNDTFYYIIETSTTEPQQTDTIPIEKVSIEIRDNETGFVLKTSTDDLPKVLENDPSSKVSTENYKNSDKSSTAEPLNPKLEDNQQVTTETTISEATQTIDVEDITENNLHVDVTTLLDDLKEENITLALEPLPIEPMPPIIETQHKLTLNENVSKEITTNESKPTFDTRADNLNSNYLSENQTSSAEFTRNYKNSDKTFSGKYVGSNLLRQNNQNRLDISSTEISTEMPSQETSQRSSTEVSVMKLLENEEITTKIPDFEVGEIIEPKKVLQESFHTDSAKEQDDLKTEQIELGFKTTPIESLDFTTEKARKEIISNETEPLYKTSIEDSTREDIVPNLLDNQAFSVENLTTESINGSKNTDKISSEEYFASKVARNDKATTEMPNLETKDFRNYTQKKLITDNSIPQDGLKKNNIEVALPTVLSKIESSSTEPQNSENEIDVFDTTTLKTLIKDKSDRIELAEQQTDAKINEHRQIELEIEKVNFTESTKISDISTPIDNTYNKSDSIDSVENNSQSNDFSKQGSIAEDKESTKIIKVESVVNLPYTEVLKTPLNETDIVNMRDESTSTEPTTTNTK